MISTWKDGRGFSALADEVRARENLPALPGASTPPAATSARSRPDGADHVVVSEALERILRRWGADHFVRATSAEDVRKQLARFATNGDSDSHTRHVLDVALALVPGADAPAVARALRAECVRDVQRLLDTEAAQHVPSRVVKLVDNVWPTRAGSLATELIKSGGATHG